MNRRQFAIGTGALTLLAMLPACWFANVYRMIAEYIPYALLAFERIISILEEHGISTAGLREIIDRVKAALSNIQTAVLEYKDAVQAEKAAKLEAIRNALRVASQRLTEFWDALRISNEQVRRTVKMLLDIIISTIEGFITRLPQPIGQVPQQRAGPVAQERSLKEFRQDFNRVLRDRGEAKFAI